MDWRHGYIAVDWGTTNRRAYLLDSEGLLRDEMEDDFGILKVPPGGFPKAVAEIRARFGSRPALLAGMVGSNRGWIEAPYVPCPADNADLFAAIRWVVPGEVGIVPGVCTESSQEADVIRGEEVQALGAVAAGLVPADALICHPGTHCKWIVMEGGRIGGFRTMMTGELFSLLRNHSILSPQLQHDITADTSFTAGASNGINGADLLSELFAVRARHVLGREDKNAASYASGLLIGSDVRGGTSLHHGGPVGLVGRPDLRALYAAALDKAGYATIHVDGATAFRAGIHALAEKL